MPARRLVRSSNDGQLGEVVEREDSNGNLRLMFKLDRPGEEILRPYNENHFTDEAERKITRMARARVAYDADRALRMALGEPMLSCKEWIMCKDEERLAFRDKGPPVGQRRDLWTVIMDHFGDAV